MLHWYNNINSRLDATMIILLTISISSTCFGREFRPSSGALDCAYSLWYKAPTMLVTRKRWVPPHPGHQQTASPVHYTTSCKHSLVLLRMGEIIARNMLSWLKLTKLSSSHLVGCLYYCSSIEFWGYRFLLQVVRNTLHQTALRVAAMISLPAIGHSSSK